MCTEWFIVKPWSCYIMHPILSTVLHNDHTNNNLSILYELQGVGRHSAVTGEVEVGATGESGEADTELSESRWRGVQESAAGVAAAPGGFELIGRTAHHLCDLLSAHGASQGGNDSPGGGGHDSVGGGSDARQEAFDVRVSVFQLSLDWLQVRECV